VIDNVIYHKTEYRERRDHFAYFACSEKIAGFDTQRETFLGSYRGWNEPTVVESGKSGNSIANVPLTAMCAALLDVALT